MKNPILILLCCFLATLFSCREKNNSKSKVQTALKTDTVLVKNQDKLMGFNEDFMTKSFSYHWVSGKDTANLKITAYTQKEDSTLHLLISHQKPVLFRVLLDKLNVAIPKIKEDFKVAQLSSIFFKATIYYPDVNLELSKDYEQKFGRKIISYQKLNQFLLQTPFNTTLNNFLKPFGRKIQKYGIEKFHLIEKKHYPSEIPDENLANYPDFSIHGMGIYVQITSLPKPTEDFKKQK